MKSDIKSKTLTLVVLLMVSVLPGCKKDSQNDNEAKIIPINCTIDLHGSARDGLSLMTMGSGFSLSSDTTQLYVQDCSTP